MRELACSIYVSMAHSAGGAGPGGASRRCSAVNEPGHPRTLLRPRVDTSDRCVASSPDADECVPISSGIRPWLGPQRYHRRPMRRVALALAVLSIAACGSSPTRVIVRTVVSPEIIYVPTPVPVEPSPTPLPVKFSGTGSKITSPFTLPAGDYRLSWSASGGEDNFIVHMHEGGQSSGLVNEIPPNPSAGQALLTTDGTSLYLEIEAGALSWTITIAAV